MLADLDLRTGTFGKAESCSRGKSSTAAKSRDTGLRLPACLSELCGSRAVTRSKRARNLVAETGTLVEQMGERKVAQYQDEER